MPLVFVEGLREYQEPIQISKRTSSFEGLSRFVEKGNQGKQTGASKRQTRAAKWNVDSLVDESWEVEWTTPNPDPKLGLHSVLQVILLTSSVGDSLDKIAYTDSRRLGQ